MTLGKVLWTLIIMKLIVIFVVVRFLFFNQNLDNSFNSNEQKSEFVIKNLIKD